MLLVDILAFYRVMCVLQGREIILVGQSADRLVLISVRVPSGPPLSWRFDGLELPIDGSNVINRMHFL